LTVCSSEPIFDGKDEFAGSDEKIATPALSLGLAEPRYPHQDLVGALRETGGVTVFHEQVLRIIDELTGTPSTLPPPRPPTPRRPHRTSRSEEAAAPETPARPIVFANGFVLSPYAETGAPGSNLKHPSRALWHASPGSTTTPN
jgi:hypothetical protein